MSIAAEISDAIAEFGLEYFGKYYSRYRATVVDNADPDFLGRLQVSVPQVYGEEQHDYWAPSVGMPTGQNMSIWAIPQVGDTIWVSFEGGNPDFPIWEYGPAVPRETPEGTKKKDNYVFQTHLGQRIELNDGEQTITIAGKGGNEIVFLKDGRFSLKNRNEDLKSLLKDLIKEIVALDIFTPSGKGMVNAPSIKTLLGIQTRLLKLLK